MNVQAGIVRGGLRAEGFATALLKTTGLGIWVVLELGGLLCLLAARVQIGQTLDPGSKRPLVSGALCRHSVSAGGAWTGETAAQWYLLRLRLP